MANVSCYWDSTSYGAAGRGHESQWAPTVLELYFELQTCKNMYMVSGLRRSVSSAGHGHTVGTSKLSFHKRKSLRKDFS